MNHFPLISVVITCDYSIPQITNCITALKKVKYPQDQLEHILVFPYYRPLPESVKNQVKPRIIKFDQTLEWDVYAARLEGATFAQGEYVLFLDASYLIHPKWLKNSLTYFAQHQVAFVSNLNQFDRKKHGEGGFNSDRYQDHHSIPALIDGLYDKTNLNKLFEQNNVT